MSNRLEKTKHVRAIAGFLGVDVSALNAVMMRGSAWKPLRDAIKKNMKRVSGSSLTELRTAARAANLK
jgi:hypothetical protein